MKTSFYKVLVKLALKAHNLSYKLSGRFAICAEGGLHPKHRLMNFHKYFLDNVEPDDTILDIGCGNGALAYDLARKVKFVIGIDINSLNIAVAKKKYNAENIEYIVRDATKDLPNRTFDGVVLSNILEHIENRVEFLQAIRRLAPRFLIRVPMINRDWITLYKKELGVEWRLDDTHFVEYTLELFQEELEGASLHLQEYSIQFGELWAIVRR